MEQPESFLAGREQILYSVEDAADMLGIGRTFMFQLIATGEINSLKIGRRRKVSRDALDAYIARLYAQQASPSAAAADNSAPKPTAAPSTWPAS
jgi:excisionase family DNA binding protein